jgi:hypothetical protein
MKTNDMLFDAEVKNDSIVKARFNLPTKLKAILEITSGVLVVLALIISGFLE